jgi:iron complex outermembrane receptor protein
MLAAGGALAPHALAQAAGVQGVVVARGTGRPVAGASIVVEGIDVSGTSNQFGRFELAGVPGTVVTLIVRARGFLDQRVPGVTVGAGEPVSVELDLTPNFMERVQVTATKTPLSVGELAAQADIVDRQAIELRGDQELVQAIANVPGLIVSGQAGSFDSVMLRGLPRDGNEFTTTLLLIDGVPQTDSRNSARVVNLPIGDASSIEVVRGPNSALYGRTAIGGAVNVRTADPTPNRQFTVELTGGEFGMAKGLFAVSGPFADRFAYYASASGERNHGYFEKDTGFRVTETAFFGKATFVPDTSSFASLSLNHVRSNNSTPTTVPIVGGRFLHEIDARFDRLTNLNVPGTNYHQGEGRVTFNYSRQLAPWARLTEIFGYRDIQYKFIDDGDVIGGPFDLARGTLTMYPFEQQTDESIVYQELRFELTPEDPVLRNSLVAGGSYEHTSGFSIGNLIYTDPDTLGWPLSYLTPVIPPRNTWQFERFGGRDYDVGVTGLFAQYLVEPHPRVVVLAGGRYDRLSIGSTLTLAAGRPHLEDSFQAFSPKMSVTYKLLDGSGEGAPAVNVYGAYSEAFLPPRRPGDLSGSTIAIDLEPENVANYEAGLKAHVLDGRLSLEATVFRMNRDGVITEIRQGPRFLPINGGEQEYKGVELGGRLSISPWGSVYLNGAFYRSRYGDFVFRDSVFTGNRLPIAPDRVVNWGFLFNARPDLDVVVNVKHVGDVFVDRANSFRFDPYTLVDAAATWRRGRMRFTLSGHNLFDQDYFWGGDTSLAESADPGRPRQILFTAGFVFR